MNKPWHQQKLTVNFNLCNTLPMELLTCWSFSSIIVNHPLRTSGFTQLQTSFRCQVDRHFLANRCRSGHVHRKVGLYVGMGAWIITIIYYHILSYHYPSMYPSIHLSILLAINISILQGHLLSSIFLFIRPSFFDHGLRADETARLNGPIQRRDGLSTSGRRIVVSEVRHTMTSPGSVFFFKGAPDKL